MPDRRTFLWQASGALALGSLGLSGLACAARETPAEAVPAALDQIGVQLYTVRGLMAEGVEGTLEQVATIGYDTVETAGLYDLAPQDFRALLDKYGLRSPAGHYGLEMFRDDFEGVVEEHGLTCAMANGPEVMSIEWGFNRREHHEELVPAYHEHIQKVAEAGLPNVICFSGNREGLSDEEGLENCAAGIKEIVPTAEEHGVMLCMELLNSKVDHPDYQCDRTPWGVELVERVGSEHFRLLYDIYHMQIMEGDVIRTIRDNHEYIAHYHTAGVPGRNEIDETQELNYEAIMRAIAETGFDGFVGQEFIPTGDPMTSLEEAIRICSV